MKGELAARDARAALKRLIQWCVMDYRYYSWSWDLAWIATTYFGSDGKPKEAAWSKPALDAFLSGAWLLFWTEQALYWIAKPTVKVERLGSGRRLHCEDGPACANDVEDLYFWHGVPVPDHAILNPDKITLQEIRAESNAEVRRALIERMTPEKYLWESRSQLVDVDHEKARRGAAPRALLRDDDGDQWLVGTDGGTKRVYYMPVPNDVKTCREAHIAICGFDESRILSKS